MPSPTASQRSALLLLVVLVAAWCLSRTQLMFLDPSSRRSFSLGKRGVYVYRVPDFSAAAHVRTPQGLLRSSEGLTTAHFCTSEHSAGCLKDIKGSDGQVLPAPGAQKFSRVRVTASAAQQSRSASDDGGAYTSVDGGSQYTQWDRANWNTTSRQASFSTCTPFSGSAPVYYQSTEPPPVYPGQDVATTRPFESPFAAPKN